MIGWQAKAPAPGVSTFLGESRMRQNTTPEEQVGQTIAFCGLSCLAKINRDGLHPQTPPSLDSRGGRRLRYVAPCRLPAASSRDSWVGQTIAFCGLSRLSKRRQGDRRHKPIVCPTSLPSARRGTRPRAIRSRLVAGSASRLRGCEGSPVLVRRFAGSTIFTRGWSCPITFMQSSNRSLLCPPSCDGSKVEPAGWPTRFWAEPGRRSGKTSLSTIGYDLLRNSRT